MRKRVSGICPCVRIIGNTRNGSRAMEEFFQALKDIGYNGPLVIESFDPGFEELNRQCAIWRKLAESGEELAVKGLKI